MDWWLFVGGFSLGVLLTRWAAVAWFTRELERMEALLDVMVREDLERDPF
jgi:hypothetical protein